MHPDDTGPQYRDDDGNVARLVTCLECGDLEWWTEREYDDHGWCRKSPQPCPVCETKAA